MRYRLINEEVNDKNVVEVVCENRGVDFNKLDEFLNPTKESRISPLIYKNMDRICDKILESVNNNKNIAILIDSDADGYCSSAMMVNYLRDVLKYERVMFLMHSNKAHGLTPEIMEKVINNKVETLIIPDASSSDFEQHKELSINYGVDVLVIDHHEAERESEYAIVLNNQLNFFGNKTLSGGGMVLKVLEQLDSILGVDCAKNYYDLVSVSLVGDSMLMNNPETRYYVQQGLRDLNNPLLVELFKGDEIRNFETISFDIAPTINAFIRVGSELERQDLFLALVGRTDAREITIRGQGKYELELSEYISKMASRIKSRQTTAIKKALESEETKIYTNELPITICILADDTTKNLTGLIGNRLVEVHNKPAIVLKKIKGKYSGSGRTTETFKEFRSYLLSQNRFEFVLGHQGAFGCAIKDTELVEFMNDISGKLLGVDSDVFLVDKAYENMVSAYEIMAIDELNNHWARGFEKPSFYIKLTGLKGDEIDIIGQKRDTIRIKHNHITYIKFKCEHEEVEYIKGININEVEIIGSFSINDYMDRLYPQVFIDRLEVKGSPKEKQKPVFGFSGFGEFTLW